MSPSGPPRRIDATCRLATPRGVGAVAVIDLQGDVDAALHALRIDPPPLGAPALRALAGVDDGLVVRWTETAAQLMPHGGPLIVRTLLDRLAAAGVAYVEAVDPGDAFPEARDAIEARMLAALSSAASPAAVDLLLEQPARWRAWPQADPASPRLDEVSRQLNRLLRPPLVVAVGRPNVGKSTLTNALARRAVSIVADAPGTTRDHVGVTLDLPSPRGGVAVRWVDAPGLGAPGEHADRAEAEAVALARAAIARADLLVVCGDGVVGWPDAAEFGSPSAARLLRAGLRSDLADPGDCDVTVSVASGRGVLDLAAAVRRRLVPDEALAWSGPWRFDPDLPG